MHMDRNGGTGSPFTAPTIGVSGTGEPCTREPGRMSDDDRALPQQIAAIVAENHELRAEVECLRAERAKMADIQARLMDAIGCKSPDRLVHDVRNVLNERELYRALADTIQD
jgi:hypothetical protein